MLAEAFWDEAVREKAITPTLRADYEFKMWMAQFERIGSFTSGHGFLSVNEEGAAPRPRNMWALWGWDRTERKFISARDRVRQEADRQIAPGNRIGRSLVSSLQRRPWYRYKGMFPWDFRGPRPSEFSRRNRMEESPLDPEREVVPYKPCGKAIPI